VGFLFNRSLKKLKKVGAGMSITASATVSAPGFTPSPSPVAGTQYTLVGGIANYNFRVDAGALAPANIVYKTERSRDVGSETGLAATMDIFVCAGGGNGGSANDLGTAGGGGGGGVIFYPNFTDIVPGVQYDIQAGNNGNNSYFGASPQPLYLLAIRGGDGGPRGSSGRPGGSGGGYNSQNTTPGLGYQDVDPSPFGQPAESITYGYGSNSSGYTGGSSGFSMPGALWNNNPMSPYIPANEFGRGVDRGSPGDNGSGSGGNGSNPPGNNNRGDGTPGSVVIRVY
tara:strand:+ start:1280 stop:2131 length:852 start_codon:yes stop_codon:yes gene_type:complete